MDGSVRAPLRHGAFRRLLGAHGAATVAQLVVATAVGVDVLDRTGSGIWLSAVGALGLLPYVLCSGLAGAVADRYPRDRVLAVSAGLRAVLALAVAAGLAAGAPVALLVVATAAVAVLGTVTYPATAAATPLAVPPATLPAANALVTWVENLAWVAGPGALGVVLLAGGPLWSAAALAGVVLLGCAAAVRGLSLTGGGAWDDGADDGVLAGLRLAARDPRVRAPLLLAVLDNVLFGYLVVLLILLADGQYAAGHAGLGLLEAAFTAGAVASLPVLARIAGGPAWLVLGGSLAVTAAGTGALVLVPGVSAAAAVLVVVGVACLVTEVAAVTSLQRSVPAEVTGRVFGLYDTLAVGGVALGSAVAGPLAEALGLRTSVLLVAALALLAQVPLVRALRRPTLKPAPTRPTPAPTPGTGRNTPSEGVCRERGATTPGAGVPGASAVGGSGTLRG